MFSHVQKKLTIIYTVMTGAILVSLLACLFFWSIRLKEQEEYASFHNIWLSVSSLLQTDAAVSHTYLSQTEAVNRAIIHIEENGIPLLYGGSWQPKTGRGRLIELAKAAVQEEGVTLSNAPISAFMDQTEIFKINGDSGDSYYCKAFVTATENGSKSLLLLAGIAPREELIRQSFPLFIVISLLGLFMILVVSWFFTGWSLKPAREGAKKQADFIAAASHELRSPLAVIRSCISAFPSEADATLLSNIDKECERMARLVSDMLLLATSDAKNWTLHKKEMEVDTLLIKTYESFLPLCREKGLKLKLRLPEKPLPVISADRQRLEQVLAILMDNAISYTPEGGDIVIEGYEKPGNRKTAAHPPNVIIEVTDSGPGIPDDMKDRIFDRFYRGDSARSDKKHFGLGLCIANELTELHGGGIAIRDREGGGSRFVVRLCK